MALAWAAKQAINPLNGSGTTGGQDCEEFMKQGLQRLLLRYYFQCLELSICIQSSLFCNPWHWSILKSTAVGEKFKLEVKARAKSLCHPLQGGWANAFSPCPSAEGATASWFGKQSCSPHFNSQPAKEGEEEQTGGDKKNQMTLRLHGALLIRDPLI